MSYLFQLKENIHFHGVWVCKGGGGCEEASLSKLFYLNLKKKSTLKGKNLLPLQLTIFQKDLVKPWKLNDKGCLKFESQLGHSHNFRVKIDIEIIATVILPFHWFKNVQLSVTCERKCTTVPVSILHKSKTGRYRPVRVHVADGQIATRCRFM